MRIESQAAGTLGASSTTLPPDKALQGIFAQVLADAGRQGYVSAELPTGEEPVSQSNISQNITDAWNNWFRSTGPSRFDVVDSPDQLRQDFGNLLVQAQETGAYAAPQAFLKSLSEDELATVQHVNRLVSPIKVDSLTEEGAINLLLPPPTQVDLNNDGLTQTGIGYSIRFPDSRTPAAVVDAWEAATADLDPGEKALRQLQMKVDVLLANIHTDAQGRFSHVVEPGDPNFVNPMADPDYSYVQQTQHRLESIEYFKNQTPRDQYERDLAFWTAFGERLSTHGAP